MMKIKFHVRMQALESLAKTAIHLAVIIVVATLMCLGSALDLSSFFPTSFAQFFLWICAFPLLTLFAAIGSFVEFKDLPFWNFFASDSMQMICVGLFALLDVLIAWAFVRFAVLKAWGVEWVKAGTTILKCFIIWGYFQIACVFFAFAWSFGGFNLPESESSAEQQTSQAENPTFPQK